MPLQDLTPKLRTRLNRVEKSTGVFILIAALLLVVGFGYYVYQTAENRGWFSDRARYCTFAKSASGLHLGDNIKLLGYEVGQITEIKPMPPDYIYEHPDHNIFVEFVILNKQINEYSGYIWTEGSNVRFNDVGGGFLGGRELEVTKGTGGYGTYVQFPVKQMTVAEARAYTPLDKLALGEEIFDGTNVAIKANTPVEKAFDKLAELHQNEIWVLEKDKPAKRLVSMWKKKLNRYVSYKYTGTNRFLLLPDETPGLTDRLGAVASKVEAALPGILDLTNKISAVLSNVIVLTSNLNGVVTEVHGAVSNATEITANLKNPEGSLGNWIFPTNIKSSLDGTLQSAQGTLQTAQGVLTRLDTNLETLNLTLANTAGITSNLNNQVQANSNIVSSVSQIIVHTDELVQGLKRFWLFRRTFSRMEHNPKPVEKPAAKPAKPDK